VLSNSESFWIDYVANQAEFQSRNLLILKRGVVHARPDIIASPVVFFAIDTPRRDPKDIVFVDPKDRTPETFIQAQAGKGR